MNSCPFNPGELIEVHPRFRRYGVELIGYPLELEGPGYMNWQNVFLTAPDMGPVLYVKLLEKGSGEQQIVVLNDGRLYLSEYLDATWEKTKKAQWRKYEHA